jgi:glycerol-3-phosphate dehydrogenase (NAD(P)+)
VKISILGAGAWGTALAASVAPRHRVSLWSHDATQAETLRRERLNQRYLPGVALPATLAITASFDEAVALAEGGLIIIATPMSGLEPMLARLPVGSAPAVWLCKGFQQGTGLLGHEVARTVRPGTRVGVISGPSFALEVALGQPTALVAASHDAALCDLSVQALHSDSLRIYTSSDPIGVEVGGAVKNVLAVATGIADGMPSADVSRPGLGLNARAALITRGLAEMTRLGVALGARAETFMGLSGLGDLVLTATGDLSRNRRVGLLLAQGLALPRILNELGHVAEGVLSAATVLQRARALGVDMPITETVVSVIEGQATPAQALERLMGREARPEA